MPRKYFATPEEVFDAVLGPPKRVVTLAFPTRKTGHAYRARLYNARQSLRVGLARSLEPHSALYGRCPWDGIVVGMETAEDGRTEVTISPATPVVGTISKE
jgi:hypothetical protein